MLMISASKNFLVASDVFFSFLFSYKMNKICLFLAQVICIYVGK